MSKLKFISNNESETLAFAEKFASILSNKDVVVFSGDLGAGKTKFIYGIATYFGIQNKVCSPTFTIVNEYDTNSSINKIYHFDVYRLSDACDFEDSIGTDYFNSGLCLIEWGENIKEILPKRTIYVTITKIDNDTKRQIEISNLKENISIWKYLE